MRASRTLTACHSILDMREAARRRLPGPIFDMLDGGAETEVTARRNTAAFDARTLMPRCLVDVSSVDTSTRILGQDVQWPVICSPTGASRLFDAEGELAVARVAARTGTLYSLSTASTYSIEQVAGVSDGPKMFQLYICQDRAFTRTLIERAKRAGYGALCVTVDTPVVGKRERDLKAGAFGPFREWPLSTVVDFARHPRWVFRRLGRRGIRLANFLGPHDEPTCTDITEQLDPSITWKDIREVADVWGGPLALKGVMSLEDARRAADVGVTALMVSNHGGRQLDGAAASFEVLPEIVRAVGNRLEIILDGGVRRGVHVLKALACGAKACSVGRPYLYGLSVGGEAGVMKALAILRDELALAMRLSGCRNLKDIDGGLMEGLHD